MFGSLDPALAQREIPQNNKISLFATERSRLSSKQQNGQTSWCGAAPLFRDWRRARFLDLVFGECK
jgi:hypothetical protein